MKRFLAALFLAISAFSAQTAPIGIVLVIADGTSLELLTATRVYHGGVSSRLNLDSLPRSAFVSTYSYDSMVTDSGAAATALARGFKTLNRAVGAPPPGQPSVPSILELAKKAGWATGVITDDTVTGGTPAPFIVEHDHREEEYLVAKLEAENLGKNCDFLLGGGSEFFQGPAPADPKVAILFTETTKILAQSDVRVFDRWEKWTAAPPSDLSRPILGIFALNKLDFIADGDRQPHLEDMVAEGLRLLQGSGKNWLLVAEAGLPDKACHFNNAKRALEEVLVLDRTIALLREKIGPNVLLLVTTDHNNGGLTLNPGQPVQARGDALLKASPITKLPVITFATGPGGVIDGAQVTPPDPNTDWTRPDAVSPALLKTGSAFHSGGDVWLLGEGPGSEAVHGFLDNTDIYKIIAKTIGGT